MSRAAPGPRAWVAAALVLAALLVAAPASAAPGTIFFTTSAPGPHVVQLWSVREDGSRPQRLRRQLPVGPEGGVAAISRDGRKVFCVCREGEVDSVRRDGSQLRRLGKLPPTTRFKVLTLGSGGEAFWVKGNKWVYGKKPEGKPRKVATFNGGVVVDERVVPSPDGRRLAVVAYGAGDVESVLTMRRDGSERTLVYQGTGLGKEIYDVAWSPNGKQLLLSDGTGGESDPKGELPVHYPRQWFLVPSDGSNPAGALLPLLAQASNPAFSPDGTQLAFTVNWGDGPQLTIAGLDGLGPRTVPGTVCRSSCEFAPRVVGWTP